MAGSIPPHSKIAWAGQAGFPGARYCCICSYSTRDKPVTPCTGENCPNSVCRECFSDAEFCCSQTTELRRARGFSRPVTHEVTSTTISEPEEANHENVDEQGEQDVQVEEPENIVQHLIASSSKEELARRLVQLQQETQRQKLIITRYKEEKKLVLNQKVVIAKTLSLLEQIETSELEQNHPQIANIATSALPSKIDTDWGEVCSESLSWRSWWTSGRPRKLAKLVDCLPPSPSVEVAIGSDSSNTSTTSDDTTATTSTASGGAAQASEREDTDASSSNDNNRGSPRSRPSAGDAEGATRRGNSRDNVRGVHSNRQPQRWRGANRRQQQEAERHPSNAAHRGSSRQTPPPPRRHPARQGHHSRPAHGHQPAPRRRDKVCDYCSRRGHAAEECHARAADERQEHLLRRVIAEVRQPVSSHLPPPPGPSHIAPQPPSWGHTPGWQWSTPPSYLSSSSTHHQLR